MFFLHFSPYNYCKRVIKTLVFNTHSYSEQFNFFFFFLINVLSFIFIY